MDVEMLLTWVGIGFYGVASVLAAWSIMRPTEANERKILLLVIGGALPLAVVLVIHGFKSGRMPVFGRFEALTFYGLAVTLTYLSAAIRHRMRGISGILVPYMTMLFILGAPAIGVNVVLKMKWPAIWLNLHVLAAFAGYAVFTMASVLAVVYLVQDHNLKHKNFGLTFERLPSLETLDSMMRRQIGFAFVMFTASIIFGGVMISLSGEAVKWLRDPKIVATAATWIVYAILLHFRISGDRHGRKVALATIVGFVFVLFAFLGVHLVAESLHDFVLAGPTGN